MNTVSRPIAEKLQAAGWVKKTHWSHVLNKPDMGIDPIMATMGCTGFDVLPAPDCGELIRELPRDCAWEIINRWIGCTIQSPVLEFNRYTRADTPEDALALMWIWCKENGYLGEEDGQG